MPDSDERESRTDRSGSSPGLLLEFWSIGVLDHLGQRSRLRNLTQLPTDPDSTERVAEILRDTVGVVLRLRETFRRYFEEVADPSRLLASLPPNAAIVAKQMRRVEVEVGGFSDSLLLATSLRVPDLLSNPLTGIFAMLHGICGMMIASLAEGRAIRGGIDVGLGVRIAPGEVYGPVTVRAHELESDHAQYPRVLIGDTLSDYVRKVASGKPTSPRDAIAQQLARHSLELVMPDTDGLLSLDPLSPAMKRFGDPYTPEVLQEANDFVVSEHLRFTNDGNMKLAARYGRLRHYFAKRLPDWMVG